MTRRTLQNYLGVNTHSGNANNRFATTAVKKNKLPQPEKKTVYNSLKNFFQNNIIAWFIHDWRVKKPYNYPTQITARSVHTVADEQTGKPVTIAIAADWGSDTPQSEFIGMKISEKDPDYTIHLGDTYYSGVESELNANYGTGGDDEGIWPRGSKGAFILAGNHEMFSSGCDFYKMIQDEQRRFGIKDQVSGVYMGQEAACFCLLTPWWCILGLDTGYNSLKTGILHLSPNNTGLQLPDALIKWLTEEVKPSAQHKGLIILSHHQYMSAFNGEDEFPNPAKQLQTIFPDREVLWICGHEHRFTMYGRYRKSNDHITAFVRCIGNGGMPDEHTKKRFRIDSKAKDYNLVLYDSRVADSLPLFIGPGRDIGYNGYALLNLNKDAAMFSYYASYGDGTDSKAVDQKVVEERWRADTSSGSIIFEGAVDLLNGSKEGLKYFKTQGDVNDVGR